MSLLEGVIFLCVLGCTLCTQPPTKPHILFILADDLGFNDVSWNNPDVNMPTLDKMARKGVIFNSSYTQPTCSPSRGALMTGYYPFHLGMQRGIGKRYQPNYLPKDKPTVAEVLKQQGYSTHLIGKWHLGFCNWNYTPTYRGFDSFYGFYSGAEDYYTHRHDGGYDFRFNRSVHHPPKRKYSTTLFGRRGAEIVLDHNSDNPLFLFMSFQGVHTPLQVPKKYSNQYEHVKNQNRRIYSGMIAAMDEAVARVMNAMRKKKYTKNLLVVFTSDNGGASYVAGSNWPLRGTKATLWEGGTRVPTFVYSKTLLHKSGYVHDGMVHVTDWMPTLVGLAGGTPSPFLDGKNQWLTISRGWMSPRNEFVYNINEIKGSAAIRMGDWKLMVGIPGQYNSWYPVRTLPMCDPRGGKWGYAQEERQLLHDEKETRRENRGFLSLFNAFANKISQTTGASATWKRIMSQLYKPQKCDAFEKEHLKEKSRIKLPRIQLYNIRDDPLEKRNLAGKKKVLVKKMMRKFKEYKLSLVPSQEAEWTKLAHPKHYDGVWSPGWC